MNDANTSEELMLRDKKTGRWIKRSDKELSLSDNFIPSTLVKVVHNEIHYADTGLIISKILASRKQDKIQSLETSYNNILDYLDNYRAYSTGVEKVFGECESSVNEFDNEIRRMCAEIDHKNITEAEVESFVNVVKAYVKVLFVYLYSAIALHKSKVKNETVIFGKIENLKSYLQDVLELILLPKNWNGKELDYRLSIYPMFIYNPEFNIKYIDELVRYDRRFDSSLHAIRCVNDSTLCVSSKNWDRNIKFTGTFEKIDLKCPRMVLLDELIKLLKDIDRLKNIREEVSDVDDVSILENFELRANQGYRDRTPHH